MRFIKHIYLIVFLFLFSCASATQQPTTLPPTTVRTPFKLPPTWTLTASVQPSETPIRPATLTFTPLPSVTPFPPTLTPSLTSNIPTPTVTPTITPTLVTDCNFWALEEGVELHSVPFDEPAILLPTLVPSVTYQAITYHPTYYELILDGERVGWADYRLLAVQSEGPGCSNLPIDNREWYEFPEICRFINEDEIDVYEDSALTHFFETLPGGHPHKVTTRYQDVYYSKDSLAAHGFYVDASELQISGDCERIPRVGVALADSWYWSKPDGQSGEQVAPLETGTKIFIQEGPIEGPKPPGASDSGSWYLVEGSWQKDGNPYGWVWSAHFKFE